MLKRLYTVTVYQPPRHRAAVYFTKTFLNFDHARHAAKREIEHAAQHDLTAAYTIHVLTPHGRQIIADG